MSCRSVAELTGKRNSSMSACDPTGTAVRLYRSTTAAKTFFCLSFIDAWIKRYESRACPQGYAQCCRRVKHTKIITLTLPRNTSNRQHRVLDHESPLSPPPIG